MPAVRTRPCSQAVKKAWIRIQVAAVEPDWPNDLRAPRLGGIALDHFGLPVAVQV